MEFIRDNIGYLFGFISGIVCTIFNRAFKSTPHQKMR